MKKNGDKKVKDINLQGRGFERFVDTNADAKYHKKLEDVNQKELEEILLDVYAKRVVDISKRRSQKSRADLQNIYEKDENLKKELEQIYTQKDKKVEINSLKNLSFQQQIFYKHYHSMIDDKLQGFYVKVDENLNTTTFENKSKNIKVIDTGDEIVGN